MKGINVARIVTLLFVAVLVCCSCQKHDKEKSASLIREGTKKVTKVNLTDFHQVTFSPDQILFPLQENYTRLDHQLRQEIGKQIGYDSLPPDADFGPMYLFSECIMNDSLTLVFSLGSLDGIEMHCSLLKRNVVQNTVIAAFRYSETTELTTFHSKLVRRKEDVTLGVYKRSVDDEFKMGLLDPSHYIVEYDSLLLYKIQNDSLVLFDKKSGIARD